MRPILILMLGLAVVGALWLPATIEAGTCRGNCAIDQGIPNAHPIAGLAAGTIKTAGRSVAAVGRVAAVAAKPVKAVAKIAKAIKNRERKPGARAVAAVGKKAGRLICPGRRGGG